MGSFTSQSHGQVRLIYLPTGESRNASQKRPDPDFMQACLHVAKYTHLTRTATTTVILIWECRLRLAACQQHEREYYFCECHT
jgi:hypothetical protein